MARLSENLIRMYEGRKVIEVEPCELDHALDKLMAKWGTREGYSREQMARAMWIWASSAIYTLIEQADWYCEDRPSNLDYEVFDQTLGEPANAVDEAVEG